MGLRIKIKSWASDLLVTWICYRGRTRNRKSKIFSIRSKLGNVVSKLVQLKHVTEFPAAGRFFVIFWKKMAILMRLGSHFARFQSHLKEQNF